ncbi:MAG: NUDIX hydrolase [Acutalibacteraceae bacterium]|nr:NUDIX hydrolase [Acutalibacteraceae bacterium]
MNLEERQLSFDYKFKGRIINLRVDEALLPNGATATREVVEHNGGICVVPITEKGEVLMVEQYRYPYGEVILEIPAGKRDGDEEPLEGGKRELREETGAVAENYTFLGELYPTPGYCGEVIYMYLATGLSFGETDPDEDEFLNVKKIPLEKAVDMIMKGEIKDAKTQTAILKVERMLKK